MSMVIRITLTAVATALASAGCATESDAFRRMSAEDHEKVAGNPSALQPPGTTVEDHLSAARRLHAIEQSACVDVPASARDEGPLVRRDVAGVRTLQDRPNEKTMLQPAGVAVYLRATPGMTEEWLGRILECHLAHHGVVGERMTDHASPLFVEDTRIALSSTGDGFRIAITSRNVSTAREIIERAQTLVQ